MGKSVETEMQQVAETIQAEQVSPEDELAVFEKPAYWLVAGIKEEIRAGRELLTAGHDLTPWQLEGLDNYIDQYCHYRRFVEQGKLDELFEQLERVECQAENKEEFRFGAEVSFCHFLFRATELTVQDEIEKPSLETTAYLMMQLSPAKPPETSVELGVSVVNSFLRRLRVSQKTR